MIFTDGMYLIEVDRVLRPGGYWILSGPPIRWKRYWRGWERTQEDLKKEQDAIEGVAKSLCWKKVIEKNDLAIWQKPINHIECNKRKKVYKTPHICKSDNPDTAWYYYLIFHAIICSDNTKTIVVDSIYLCINCAEKVQKYGNLHNPTTRGKQLR